jgi:uncharacterized protein (DUF58 family)
MPKYTLKRPALFSRLKQTIFNKLFKTKHLKNSITLEHRNIYVLPSSLGMYFLVVAVLNFIMGINYQNNLILVMAYLMFVVLLIAVLIGYSNAKGLTVSFHKLIMSFSPQSPHLVFHLSCDDVCQSVMLTYQGLQNSVAEKSHVNKVISELTLTLPYNERGKYLLKRIRISSNYPFGLVKVWSYILLDEAAFVYPAMYSIDIDKTNHSVINSREIGNAKTHGTDEFEHLIPHLPEMGLQRVSWKHYAKTQHLLVKEFVDYTAKDIAFDFNAMQGHTEQRLSQLCYLICESSEKNIPFTLKLPNKIINANSGMQHKLKCLRALSEYSKVYI